MMNYKKIYDSIILKAKNRPPLTEYFEKHHIIPRCLGGNNFKQNIVCLTMREHYLAHKLLVRIYPENKALVHALWMMSNGSCKTRPVISARHYEEARKLFIESVKGRTSPMKGKKHSQETKNKISKSKKGQDFWTGRKHSEEARKKQSIFAKNKNVTEEQKLLRNKKISESKTGKPYTPEHRKNIAEAKKGNKNPMFGKVGNLNKLSKKIYQFDLEKNFIREWENMTIAEKELNFPRGSLSATLKTTNKQKGGFLWSKISLFCP